MADAGVVAAGAGMGSLAQALPPSLDLTGVCFRDQIFLNFVGGNLVAHNVFDYFASSPFYDRSCNNEQLRMQGIHPLDTSHLTKLTGWEYALHHVQEPHLFIIKKQKRENAEKASPVAVYYVLDGSIYQAPQLHGVIGARIMRSLNHIQNAFSIVKKKIEKSSSDEDDVKERQKIAEEEEKKERGRKEKRTRVDLQNIARMDQIIFSVLKKFPPAPPPPTSAVPTPKPPTTGEPATNPPEETPDDRAPIQAGPKRQKRTT